MTTTHKFSPPFSEDGTQVTDTSGKTWMTDVWQDNPFPKFPVLFNDKNIGSSLFRWDKKWLVRKPIAPPEPVAKSQAEIDSEAFVQWAADAKHFEYRSFEPWKAALAWERDRVMLKEHPIIAKALADFENEIYINQQVAVVTSISPEMYRAAVEFSGTVLIRKETT